MKWLGEFIPSLWHSWFCSRNSYLPRHINEVSREFHLFLTIFTRLLDKFISSSQYSRGCSGNSYSPHGVHEFVFFLMNEGSLTWFGSSNPISLVLWWKGEFDLVVEFTGFLCFTGEMVEPIETDQWFFHLYLQLILVIVSLSCQVFYFILLCFMCWLYILLFSGSEE